MSSNTKITSTSCKECSRQTRHEIICEHSNEYFIYPDDDPPEGQTIEFVKKHRIIRCCGCHTVSFQELLWESESRETTETLYPSRAGGRQSISASDHFPQKVRRIYSETLKALNADAPTLAAIGLRALVEAICIDQTCLGGNLQEKIDALVTTGALSKNQADFLHIHRFLGNEAAHEITPPPADELLASLDILESLLKTIYELPVIAAAVRQSKNRRNTLRQAKQ
ncbi:MAG TPA: DUF4145 domain-containing protein [Pyrinomonadaceae bacterium]